LLLSCGIHAQPPRAANIVLKTTDARIELSAGSSAPRLVSLTGVASARWLNRQEETLPAAADVNGLPVPVVWQFMPELSSADAHHAVFVYDSAPLHLRLRWQWEAQKSYGPFEHRITVENLADKEVWLPLIDSLRLDWRPSASAELRNFYIEKGADTPSAQGTHLEPIEEGYHWIGRSSTYAHPVPGQGREIIPIEFIYTAANPHAGWYAGS